VTLPDTAASLPTPLLSPRYRWATIGMVSLIFLAAFEALAVTTIMPTVSADLDGRAWFSAAFSVTLAASVVGMVAGGMWADYMPLKLWGAAVGIVSLGTVGLAITGIWMWWLRKKERRFGLIVIVVNVVFAITVLAMMRAAGP